MYSSISRIRTIRIVGRYSESLKVSSAIPLSKQFQTMLQLSSRSTQLHKIPFFPFILNKALVCSIFTLAVHLLEITALIRQSTCTIYKQSLHQIIMIFFIIGGKPQNQSLHFRTTVNAQVLVLGLEYILNLKTMFLFPLLFSSSSPVNQSSFSHLCARLQMVLKLQENNYFGMHDTIQT